MKLWHGNAFRITDHFKGICRQRVESLHKGPVMRKALPCHNVGMETTTKFQYGVLSCVTPFFITLVGRYFCGFFCKSNAFANHMIWYILQMCRNKWWRCYNTTLLRTSHVTSNSVYSRVIRGNPLRVVGHGRVAIWDICPKLILHSNLAKSRSSRTSISFGKSYEEIDIECDNCVIRSKIPVTISEAGNMLWANNISEGLIFRCV